MISMRPEVPLIVAMQHGLTRLNRFFVLLTWFGIWGSLAGLTVWLTEFFSIGRWGPGELVVMVFYPISIALTSRVIAWILEGFRQQ